MFYERGADWRHVERIEVVASFLWAFQDYIRHKLFRVSEKKKNTKIWTRLGATVKKLNILYRSFSDNFFVQTALEIYNFPTDVVF